MSYEKRYDKYETIKSINLDIEQYKTLRGFHRELQATDDVTKKLVSALVDKQVEEHMQFWDGVARLAGFEDYESVDAQGIGLRCDWARHTIDIEKAGDKWVDEVKNI